MLKNLYFLITSTHATSNLVSKQFALQFYTGVKSARMYQISEEAKKKVYEAFGRTKEMVDEDVEVVRKWMESQPHLPEVMDAVKIRNFLHLNKFSVEKTKQKLDMYYTMRSLIPDMYVDSNPKSTVMQTALNDMIFAVHPYALDGTYRIYIVKSKRPNIARPLEMLKVFFATYEVRLYEDFMIGDIFIVDFNNITLSDMKKATLGLLTKSFAVYQKVYSLRLKNLIFLNSPPYVSMLVSILKVALKQKIFDRLQVHQDDKYLSEILPREHLPKDYGGDGPSLQELTDMTVAKLREYQERFDLLDTLTVDESLRPEKLDNDEILGFYGNFKKLDID